jgi:hypothetical protein
MSRIIRTDNPTTVRNRNRRTVAEILRRLSRKSEVDAETKDMVAAIVYLLREIDAGVKKSAAAWEKRDYWIKAERFMREWAWTAEMAANLEDVLREDALDLLPRLLAELFPRFADIEVKRLTRSPKVWQGAYKKLMAEPPGETPW